jgi:hypothetical protein
MAASPSLAGLHAAWEASDAEDAFWQEHYSEYLRKYPEKFVAVDSGTVVATNSDLQQLWRTLGERAQDSRRVWVRFITADPEHVTP